MRKLKFSIKRIALLFPDNRGEYKRNWYLNASSISHTEIIQID